jgi:hypothetical protein
MKFILLVKADKKAEAGALPDEKLRVQISRPSRKVNDKAMKDPRLAGMMKIKKCRSSRSVWSMAALRSWLMPDTLPFSISSFLILTR